MHPFFNPRKRRLPASSAEPSPTFPDSVAPLPDADDGGEPTEVRLALLASVHPYVPAEVLLDVLLAHGGSVPRSLAALKSSLLSSSSSGSKSASARIGTQRSLFSYAPPPVLGAAAPSPLKKLRPVPLGQTLHLYDPADVAARTPCTLIPGFLPAAVAAELLTELLAEAATFERGVTFRLFDAVVSSPHTMGFYVESYDEVRAQRTEYVYNGSAMRDVRRLTPTLARVRPLVEAVVNDEIRRRTETHHGGRKLRHQCPDPWVPNVALVNCYEGARQNVGWHSDTLTYLGPRAVIGSISLGVAREFRIRRVGGALVEEGGGAGKGAEKDGEEDEARGEDEDEEVRDGEGKEEEDDSEEEEKEGQIAIHLPHNSLLVMHADMQEEWKHCIHPATAVDAHPIAGAIRINITYRDYKKVMHPRFTPRCGCGVACVLRVARGKRRRRQRPEREKDRGRYFWACYVGNVPGREGCAFFQWAEFDEDGNPPWAGKVRDERGVKPLEEENEADGRGGSQPVGAEGHLGGEGGENRGAINGEAEAARKECDQGGLELGKSEPSDHPGAA